MNFITEYRNVRKLLHTHCPVLFYAESRYYYTYLEPLISDILQKTSLQVYYITSDKMDPLLLSAPDRFFVVYIHSMLGFLFPRLRANLMIMTMTDLDNFLYKRSPTVRHYAYLFHAAVSTHQQYTKTAFFHYDAIFCAGDYHQEEIREVELKYNLPPKQTINYGYPLFGIIRKKLEEHIRMKGVTNVLIAPSWYESCILETCIEEVVRCLAVLPYHVKIRPHPEYLKRRPQKWRTLRTLIRKMGNVSIDQQPDVILSIVDSDFLVTDRSGIAFEFAFGMYRPVLFIDTPGKIMNPDWQELRLQPLENSIRRQIGITIAVTEIPLIEKKLAELKTSKETFSIRLKELEKELFYNVAKGKENAIKFLLERTSVV